MSVESTPAGAELVVDGELLGKTPLDTDDLTAGEHTLVLRLADYHSLEKKVTLVAGERTRLSLQLEHEDGARRPDAPPRKAARGKLNLSTKPWVSVFAGKQNLGDTPLKDVTLPAGKHLLRLVNAEAGINSSIEVEIKPNETTFKKLKL